MRGFAFLSISTEGLERQDRIRQLVKLVPEAVKTQLKSAEWVEMPCSLVSCKWLPAFRTFIFRVDERDTFFRNVGNHLEDHGFTTQKTTQSTFL